MVEVNLPYNPGGMSGAKVKLTLREANDLLIAIANARLAAVEALLGARVRRPIRNNDRRIP